MLFARGHGQSGFERAPGARGLAGRSVGAAQLQVVRELVRLERRGLLEMIDRFGDGRGRQAAVKDLEEKPRGGAEFRDLQVPAAEYVVRPRVAGVQGERARGVFADQPGGADLFADVPERGELAAADRHRQHAFGVVRIERRGALGIAERLGQHCLALGRVRQFDREIGILPGDFLEEKRVARPRFARGLKQRQRLPCVQPGLGGEGVAYGRVGCRGGPARHGQQAGEKEPEYVASCGHRSITCGKGSGSPTTPRRRGSPRVRRRPCRKRANTPTTSSPGPPRTSARRAA